MEKIFGGLDFVEAGESEGGSEKREARALVADDINEKNEKTPASHLEGIPAVVPGLERSMA
jgi:hypothetical protein